MRRNCSPATHPGQEAIFITEGVYMRFSVFVNDLCDFALVVKIITIIRVRCTLEAPYRRYSEPFLTVSSHDRKRALRTKATVKECVKECTQCVLDNSSRSDNTDTDGI